MKKSKSLYHGHRFPAGVISCAVRWYFRFQLSLRDIEELLFERGVIVTYETIRCWCAFEPGSAQDRHRSVAQLSGGKSRDSRTCEREARVRQSGRSTEQPGGEQPPADTRTRASNARLSRPEAHTRISLVLRTGQATLRTESASTARPTLSQTTRGKVRRMARIHQRHPSLVLRFLRHVRLCHLSGFGATS